MPRRRINWTAFLTFLIISQFVLFPLPLHALEDGIIAVVNDEIITLKDLRDYIHAIYVQMKTDGTPAAKIKEAMADLEKDGIARLIENKLILNEANHLKIEINPEQIDAKFAEFKKFYPSDQDFLSALIEQGATPNDLRKKIVEQSKIRQTIESEVRSKVYVNPQEVTEYYKEHFDQYINPEQVELDSIYIKKGADPVTAKAKADKALAKLRLGSDFKPIEKEFSEGPPIGSIAKGQLIPEIEKVIFSLKTGAISEVTEVEEGFYIFRVNKHLLESIANREDVKDKIYNEIFQIRFQQKYREWLNKLKGKAFIDIKSRSR